MIGERLSHYRIERPLGRGGMGEVFLAQDLALGRAVAIKVLPHDFDEVLRRSLIAEAETSRRLQHPGIATFFEAGEADGIAFIAMEYVRGETLRERLRRGPLTIPLALGVASGLLEAIGHAHAAGIVHRDLKPENVMVTGEEAAAKLLDFGIARRPPSGEAEAAASAVTILTGGADPGTLIGSLGYMAPEQLRGEPADARSDLFALTAVLHEMISGRPAFPGANAVARIAATMAGETARPEGIADDLADLLRRGLARNPADRFASAADFLRAIRRLDAEAATPGLPETLAVLDFENRSPDPADAWIGVGIAESLVADLGRQPGLGLVPRPKIARVLATPGAATDPAAIGARLGCRWVLSGSCQRMGPALRLVVQVTHVPTEQATATEKIDGRVEDLFALQDRLGRFAVDALQLEARAESAATPRARPVLGAYAATTRGFQHFVRMSKGEFDRAEELFEEAIAEDPDYADALTGLAAIHDMRFTFTTDRAELEKARGFAQHAADAAPGHAAARVWLGYALWRLGQLDAARATFRRAAELDPVNYYPPYFHACVLASGEDHAAALPDYQRAVELGPGFGFAWVGLGHAHMETGHADEALWSLGRGIELERAGFHATAGAAGYLGEFLRRVGRLDEARAQCLAGIEAVEKSDHMYRDTLRAVCLNALGRVALDQGDREAAGVAFRQCELHVEGRPRTLGGGWLLTQARAGRALAEGTGPAAARALFERRDSHDWSWLWTCTEAKTREDLGRAGA